MAVDLLYNYKSLLLFILILSWLSTLGISLVYNAVIVESKNHQFFFSKIF